MNFDKNEYGTDHIRHSTKYVTLLYEIYVIINYICIIQYTKLNASREKKKFSTHPLHFLL